MNTQGGTAISYEEHSTESLTRCLTQLHGLHNAVLLELLSVTAEIDRRNACRADGFRPRLPSLVNPCWSGLA